jgi:hypothetical protein
MKIIASDVKQVPDDYKTINLSEKWNIIVSNRSFRTPLLNFKLAEELPCMNTRERGFTAGRRFYPLFKLDYVNGGCKSSFAESLKFDTRYDFIDKIEEDDLYADNSLWEEISALPNYETYQLHKI